MESELNTTNGRLQAFRKAKKLSGESFGELIGLTKSGLSNVENGRAKVSIDFLEVLIKEFPDLNLHWLINGEGEMLQQPVSIGAGGPCWDELEKEQRRYNQLLTDYQDLQAKLKALEI